MIERHETFRVAPQNIYTRKQTKKINFFASCRACNVLSLLVVAMDV